MYCFFVIENLLFGLLLLGIFFEILMLMSSASFETNVISGLNEGSNGMVILVVNVNVFEVFGIEFIDF